MARRVNEHKLMQTPSIGLGASAAAVGSEAGASSFGDGSFLGSTCFHACASDTISSVVARSGTHTMASPSKMPGGRIGANPLVLLHSNLQQRAASSSDEEIDKSPARSLAPGCTSMSRVVAAEDCGSAGSSAIVPTVNWIATLPVSSAP
eukprot:4264381-Prymnesium_polylepis.2